MATIAIDPIVFRDALGKALKWVPGKPVIPSTGGFLLVFEEDKIQVSAMDPSSGDITLYISADGHIDHEPVVVEAKRLYKIVTAMAGIGNDISLSLKKEKLHVECGSHKVWMNLLATEEEFPNLPEVVPDSIMSVDAADFTHSIKLVKDAADPDNPREVLSGIHFNGEDTVSADGVRVIVKSGVKVAMQPTTIPASVCFKVSAVLSNCDEDVKIGMSSEYGKMSVGWGSGIINAPTIPLDFPDYRMIVPKTIETNVVVPKKELVTGLNIVSEFSSEVSNLMRLAVGEEEIKLASVSMTGGDNSHVPIISVDGPGTEVGVSSAYLLDAISNMPEEVYIGLNGKKGIIKIHNGGGFMHCIMPMHIRE